MPLNDAAHIASSCDVVIITVHYGYDALLYGQRYIMSVKVFLIVGFTMCPSHVS
jgi:hypothetical protein